MKEATITPFAKPLYIMTKPVGAVCNLAGTQMRLL